ncbi:hypothetical protein RAMDARK_1163 [Rickettsia amblyommatis str. Darkwater]|nr:hypothetical protein RAMDARK_1163 [Rickettsia amblyommatis str. Darkwater]
MAYGCSNVRRARAYFEIYDERSSDPHSAIVDIYIGIKLN